MPTITVKQTDYKATIGIETHVQLKTKTKLFAAVGNDARQAPPNSLISHICLGMPGALPVLNEAAVSLAVRAAFALGTKPQAFSKFDRKHYFYPDLPKGYQISQYEQPIIVGGFVDIMVDGQIRRIGITRAHLEEDAGKNTHPAGAEYSLVDLNRAGTPLLEIVSEPDMHSPSEAKAYARELYLLMKYADVSDCNLYHGNIRFDVNVSVSKERERLGIRSEVKNLNSFKSVENAVAYEVKRQTELLQKGKAIVQETRGWDEAKQKTTSQRGKEESHDYRYMPEPDVPPIVLDEITYKDLHLPTLPMEWREKLKDLIQDTATIETLIEAEVEFENVKFLDIIAQNLTDKDLARFLINWRVNISIPLMREGKIIAGNDRTVVLERQIYELVKAEKLSSTNARALFTELATNSITFNNVEEEAIQRGHIQISSESELEKIVAEVITENPEAAADIQNGEIKAIGFLVGQVMKKSAGKANPSTTQELIKRQLGV